MELCSWITRNYVECAFSIPCLILVVDNLSILKLCDVVKDQPPNQPLLQKIFSSDAIVFCEGYYIPHLSYNVFFDLLDRREGVFVLRSYRDDFVSVTRCLVSVLCSRCCFIWVFPSFAVRKMLLKEKQREKIKWHKMPYQ